MTERQHAAVLPPDTIVSTADTVTALLRTKTDVSADHCQQKRGLLGPKWGWRGCQRSTDSWQASASSSLWTWTLRSSVKQTVHNFFLLLHIVKTTRPSKIIKVHTPHWNSLWIIKYLGIIEFPRIIEVHVWYTFIWPSNTCGSSNYFEEDFNTRPKCGKGG